MTNCGEISAGPAPKKPISSRRSKSRTQARRLRNRSPRVLPPTMCRPRPRPPDTWEGDPRPTVEATQVANLPTSEAPPPPPYREAERPRGSFRPPPPRYGPPPGAPRDTGVLPISRPRRQHTVGPAAAAAATPPGASAHAARPTTATTGPALAPRRRRPRQPHGTTAERFIRGSDPGRRPRSRLDVFPRVGAGALRFFKATFGLVNLGPGPGTRSEPGPARGEGQVPPFGGTSRSA